MSDVEFPRLKKDDLIADYPGVFDTARYVDVGIGWLGLVRDFVAEALPHDPSLEVLEIKEKWATMRIWCDTPVVAARIAKGKAEIKSALTCEVCGDPGHLRRPPPGRMSWWRTLCDEHASEDQRVWSPPAKSPLHDLIQVAGRWYRYDEATDTMIETETPERFR